MAILLAAAFKVELPDSRNVLYSVENVQVHPSFEITALLYLCDVSYDM